MVESRKETRTRQSGRSALPQVMSALTITELEMLPKLEELRRMEEISVGGSTHIHNEVIAAIAGLATRETEGGE